MGVSMGPRILELLAFREGKHQRKPAGSPIALLTFVQTTVWRALFGQPARGLERSGEAACEYFLLEGEPVTNRFVSVPRALGQLNCAAFVAGIVEGVLVAAGLRCGVQAAWAAAGAGAAQQTVYVVRIESEDPGAEAVAQAEAEAEAAAAAAAAANNTGK